MEQNRESFEALKNPKIYPDPVHSLQILETHLSWIFLTGPYAYKLKKGVNLGFADFTTLEKRKFYCQEEIRLNQRLAHKLDYELFEVKNPKNQSLLDYAVRMKQFDQHQLLSYYAQQQTLTLEQLYDIAEQIAAFHDQLKPISSEVDPTDKFGSPELINKTFLDNFSSCESLITEVTLSHRSTLDDPDFYLKNTKEALNLQKKWAADEFEHLIPIFIERKKQGFIRECHGDLHLGNMVFLDNQVVIFDCIEFNLDFRWIDTMDEIAFLLMDLQTHGYSSFVFYFLNHYLTRTGDYAGLTLLRFYELNRALVREKVALFTNNSTSLSLFNNYLKFANQLIQESTPRLIITFGVSGSGKTTLSRTLAPLIKAIHIRSDVERKRLFQPKANVGVKTNIESKLKTDFDPNSLYTLEKNKATYDRLYHLAESLLKAGFSVIVDATFLKHEYRTQFHGLATKMNVPFGILHSIAPLKLLHRRVFERAKSQHNESDANIHVLNDQFAKLESLSDSELPYSLIVETDNQMDIETLAKHHIFRQ